MKLKSEEELDEFFAKLVLSFYLFPAFLLGCLHNPQSNLFFNLFNLQITNSKFFPHKEAQPKSFPKEINR
ncbi:hypothetical protein, partial [Archaeoglobus sp.]